MNLKLIDIKKEIKKLENKEKAKFAKKYFKAFPGGYGEGDEFLGINMPVLRKLAKKYSNISFEEIEELLNSKFHEERVLALLILSIKSKTDLEKCVQIYLKNIHKVNNWDLVDGSAPEILGPYLKNKDKSLLYEFANSENIWKQRISILTTFYYIKKDDFSDAIKIAEILISKKRHDLINKAVGWTLREIGKKNKKLLIDFLKKHYNNLSRTTIRYAIEKFDNDERKRILKGIF
ncbi:MAG: DNA alkylation repair protein [Thermosipho sp. (in: Bacteria)]|nr:DNA alkylation repair protein [Thermosipho sp. (in: thermotogales)]